MQHVRFFVGPTDVQPVAICFIWCSVVRSRDVRSRVFSRPMHLYYAYNRLTKPQCFIRDIKCQWAQADFYRNAPILEMVKENVRPSTNICVRQSQAMRIDEYRRHRPTGCTPQKGTFLVHLIASSTNLQTYFTVRIRRTL